MADVMQRALIRRVVDEWLTMHREFVRADDIERFNYAPEVEELRDILQSSDEPSSGEALEASRYRWLRDHADSGAYNAPYVAIRKFIDGRAMTLSMSGPTAEGLDALIDALAAANGERDK